MSYAELLRRYRAKHRNLVEPRQGFESLDPSLWLAYSMGRKRGFTDLGTYANKPGDHGYYPALAFDLGRRDRFFNKGWNYIKARRLAKLYVEHHRALNIDYVILGMRIWSRWGATQKKWDEQNGWHPYQGDRSHMFHIHVSGVERPK